MILLTILDYGKYYKKHDKGKILTGGGILMPWRESANLKAKYNLNIYLTKTARK